MPSNLGAFQLEDRVLSIVYPTILSDLLKDLGVEKSFSLRTYSATQLPSQSRISHTQFHHQILQALKDSGDPGLGFKFGHKLNFASLGILGQLLMSCQNLGEGLNNLLAYFPLSGLPLSVNLSRKEDPAVVEMEYLARSDVDPAIERFFVEALLVSWLEVVNTFAGKTMRYREIQLPYEAPSYAAVYQKEFQCPVHFKREVTRGKFDGDLFDIELPTHNETIKNLCILRCEKKFSSLQQQQTLSGKLLQLLLHAESATPSCEYAAYQLKLSPRSLSRQLQLEGTSYRQLLDTARLQRAKEYLCTPQMPVENVALQLGFSDASNFRRAFKKWTGQTPSQFRKHIAANS